MRIPVEGARAAPTPPERPRFLGMTVTPARRITFFVLIDAALVCVAVALAALLRFDGVVPRASWPTFVSAAAAISVIGVAAGSVAGLYRVAWSFFSLRDVGRVALAVSTATAVTFTATVVLRAIATAPTPALSVLLMQAPLAFCLISAFRLSKRGMRLLRRAAPSRETGDRTLLIGAGIAGAQVLRSIQSEERKVHVVGILDDDALAHGTVILGARVLGSIADIESVVRRDDVKVVVICIANADSALVRRIFDACQKAGVAHVRIVPPVSQLLDGQVTFQKTREVTLEDLLGRDPVRIDLADLEALLRGRTILVTGAAGTIGSELCRQVARLDPERLLVLDNDETRLHDLGLELRALAPAMDLAECLVDVRNVAEVEAVFAAGPVDIVFHAAAYKHVPMMERAPVAALSVNLLGTLNVARAAARAGCGRFVLISTDKAVEPSSIMGASKRLAELALFAELAGHPSLRVSGVRFGNVIGSRGSVIPTFERQLQRGGPLTVTHPEVERYFMITSEAVQLVLQAAALGGRGGDIFVLDMGKPVRILDVAREFIRLHGMEPGRDVNVVFTGLRPGEKLTESLHYPYERLTPTAHSRILKTRVDLSKQVVDVSAAEAIVRAHDEQEARAYFLAAFPELETHARLVAR